MACRNNLCIRGNSLVSAQIISNLAGVAQSEMIIFLSRLEGLWVVNFMNGWHKMLFDSFSRFAYFRLISHQALFVVLP